MGSCGSAQLGAVRGWLALARVRGSQVRPCCALACQTAEPPAARQGERAPEHSPLIVCPGSPGAGPEFRTKRPRRARGSARPCWDPPGTIPGSDRPGAPPAPGRPRHLAAAAGAAGGAGRRAAPGWEMGDGRCALGRKTLRETSQPEKSHSVHYLAVGTVFLPSE